MTPKTETLYCFKNIENLAQALSENKVIEPVTVHVAGDLYKKVEPLSGYVASHYEKVTHVLPTDKESLTVETSDEYEWVLLKEGEILKLGDEALTITISIGFQPAWKPCLKIGIPAPKWFAYRRKVSKSSQNCETKEWDLMRRDRDELQKKVEELEKWKKDSDFIIELDKQTIESQKREIEKLKEEKSRFRHLSATLKDGTTSALDKIWYQAQENARLTDAHTKLKQSCRDKDQIISENKKEINRLKSELEGATREIQCGLSANKELREQLEDSNQRADKYSEIVSGLREILDVPEGSDYLIALEKRLEEAKKGEVRWVKIEDKHSLDLRDKKVVCLFEDGRISLEPNLYMGQTHYLEIPKIPSRTIDDEAQEAWDRLSEKEQDHEENEFAWKRGFKAAKGHK